MRGVRAFRAVVARSKAAVAEGEAASQVLEFGSVSELPKQDPAADVEVAITHSCLNFKDAMILLGQKGVVRGNGYPIVAGIDYAGTVARSRSPLWQEGDRVVLTGNKAGQFFDGGYSERATVRAEWLVASPPQFSLAQAMAVGTAGITAAQCVSYLEGAGEVRPSHGPVLVTGAAGGLGQLAIPMLRSRGFEVIASTGRKATLGAHLEALGATEVIDRPGHEAVGRAAVGGRRRHRRRRDARGGARADKVPRRPRVPGRRRRRRAVRDGVPAHLAWRAAARRRPDTPLGRRRLPRGSCALGGVAKREARDVGILRGAPAARRARVDRRRHDRIGRAQRVRAQDHQG